MEEKRELISLMQSPLIYYKLEELSAEIKEKVENANKLVVNEETYKEVKKVRAELKKDFEILEAQRKMVKKAILEPYEEFENVYKEKVANIYKEADEDLKHKITVVEDDLKVEKTQEIREFAEQYFEHYDLDFCSFEDMQLNITLTSSMKSLKEKVLEWISQKTNDVLAINEMEDKNEILYEYKKNGYNVGLAIKTVKERKEALKKIQENVEKEEIKQEIEEELVAKVEEVIEELTPPEPIEITTLADEEEQFVVSFTVTGTLTQIRNLKEYMKKEGLKYD